MICRQLTWILPDYRNTTDLIRHTHLKPALCGGFFVLPIWPTCCLLLFPSVKTCLGLDFLFAGFRAGRQVVVSPFTHYWFCKHPFWPYLRKICKISFFAAHAALLSSCSGGWSVQNGSGGERQPAEKKNRKRQKAPTQARKPVWALGRW